MDVPLSGSKILVVVSKFQQVFYGFQILNARVWLLFFCFLSSVVYLLSFIFCLLTSVYCIVPTAFFVQSAQDFFYFLYSISRIWILSSRLCILNSRLCLLHFSFVFFFFLSFIIGHHLSSIFYLLYSVSICTCSGSEILVSRLWYSGIKIVSSHIWILYSGFWISNARFSPLFFFCLLLIVFYL